MYKTPPNGGWSAPSPSGLSDESAWLAHESSSTTAPTNALEGGYYTGAGSGVPFTTGLVPYYTLNDGAQETDDVGHFLSPNTAYATYLVSGGYVNVGGNLMNFSYTIQQDGVNFAQGETDTTGAWMMNGATGETYTGYWSPNGSNWYLWGFNMDCHNSPYFATNVSTHAYKNGGY